MAYLLQQWKRAERDTQITTIAVAHQASSASRDIALREAARETQLRGADLAVLHVVDNLDLDVAEAYEHGLKVDIEHALGDIGAGGVTWQVHLATAKEEGVAETILAQGRAVNAELLVIGARRRSPVGKALLGSVTQTLILQAEVPVLVVKSVADSAGTQ